MTKTKIYTRYGDNGETSLVGNTRIKKFDIRVDAYGTVDELNCHLGFLATYLSSVDKIFIVNIQKELFRVGTSLATPYTTKAEIKSIGEERVRNLENEIDKLQEILPDKFKFIIPGGTRASCECQIARTICRRAERRIAELGSMAVIDPILLSYMNRLSDFLYVFALKLNFSNV